MNDTPAPASQGVLHTWAEFEAMLAEVLDVAGAHGSDLTLVDRDFQRWPLGSAVARDRWERWLRARQSSQARLLAQSWDEAGKHQPAWVRWHAVWGHRIRCLEAAPDDAPNWPGTLAVAHGKLGLKWGVDGGRNGIWSRDARQLRQWLTEADVILQRSCVVAPNGRLGL